MKTEKTRKPERVASFGPSMVMMLIVIFFLSYFIIGLGKDVHVPLAFICGIAMIYGTVYMHIPFKELGKAMFESISTSLEAMMIILLIGATVGTWVASGTVPIVIYYGLKIFSPKFFLASIVVICAIMSVITGSSWTTTGTVGIAFMGVGEGLGINPAITAGALICGAYFGDKQSPMSDTTNYAAAVSGTDLYSHVRSMLYTTGPSILVCLVMFGVMGARHKGAVDISAINEINDGLASVFNLNPILLLPLFLMIILIVLKVPAIPCIMSCSIIGMIFGMIFQSYSLDEVCTYFYSG